MALSVAITATVATELTREGGITSRTREVRGGGFLSNMTSAAAKVVDKDATRMVKKTLPVPGGPLMRMAIDRQAARLKKLKDKATGALGTAKAHASAAHETATKLATDARGDLADHARDAKAALERAVAPIDRKKSDDETSTVPAKSANAGVHVVADDLARTCVRALRDPNDVENTVACMDKIASLKAAKH